MRNAFSVLVLGVLIGLPMGLMAQEVGHQPFSIDARIGLSFPTGDLSRGQRGIATKVGLTRGVAALLRLHSSLSVYAGWTRHGFSCDNTSDCAEDATVESSGFDAGVRIVLPHRTRTVPWLRVGATLHRFKYELDGVAAESETTPGVELGAGADIELHRFFVLTPGVRFGYYQTTINLETFNTGAEGFIVSSLAVDIGGRLRF